MNLKAFAAKLFAKIVDKQTKKWANNPVETQQKVFNSLIFDAQNTSFGKDHGFSEIKNFDDFAKKVPVRDYEGLKSYVDLVVAGKENILWKGKPIYFAKTSDRKSVV